jgi:type VI secretion system protein ImpC
MSTDKVQSEQQAAAEAQQGVTLDDILEVMPAPSKERSKELTKELLEWASKGVVSFDKDVIRTVKKMIGHIDEAMSKQLSAIMHAPEFQKLEGSWRGLHHLVQNSETGEFLKLRVLNVSKRDLFNDLDRAIEFDQSQVFKKIYEEEYGTAGGVPYGALIGDYEFENHPEDIALLGKMSNVAAAGFSPFLSAASPKLFQMDSFSELHKPRDLTKIFDTVEYTQWKSFRASDDSRFVALTCPRTLSRLPYGANTKTVEEFAFEEVELGKDGKPKFVPHDQYAWMNTAYVLGTRLTNAFSKTGFCVAIRGKENGGLVEDLPAHIFKSDDGDMDLKCPTEVGITDRREYELSNLGFLPLVHNKNTNFSVFYGGQTTQRPQIYDVDNATANAKICARLPYIMAVSRFSHYLKIIARDKIGSNMDVPSCQKWLNRWINNYVCGSKVPTEKEMLRRPLRAAQVSVEEDPASPGAFHAVIHMQPFLQMEELTASMRMVARIPALKK